VTDAPQEPTSPPLSGDAETLRLELPLNFPLADVIAAQEAFLALVTNVAKAMQPDDNVSWVVSGVRQASVELAVQPAPNVRDIGHVVPDGLRLVSVGAERPPFFTDDVLDSTHRLASLSGRLPGMAVKNGHAGETLTLQVARNAEAIIDRDVMTEIGTVEGRLEGINLHRRHRVFAVYDALTDQRVECRFAHRITLDEVREALARRVAVHGAIRYRSDRRIQHVMAHRLEVFPNDEDLPTFADVRGILGEAR
jgi:hypothetical protein